MDYIRQNVPHMIMGALAVIAAVVLAMDHIISGGEALTVIGAATGFTMGASAGSTSSTGVPAITPATSVSPGQKVTETMTHEVSATNPTPPVT